MSDSVREDESDDGLWQEFEHTALAVAHLFRGANWRNLQTAAASTTQLYKTGLESRKRSFEKGFNSGRQALAKEIYALCRFGNANVDVEQLVTLLSRYGPLPPESSSPSRRNRNSASSAPNEGAAAVNLFQQALCPSPPPSASASPATTRSPELNNFLQNQVYRHRKRNHSPASTSSCDSSHTNYLNKRFKRL
ncbi:UPF0472 protein C16orf72 like protein [Ditylenchus destructor]|nr:UPF0472 protein C16orf72 like protein [Ditylenchus destructor]